MNTTMADGASERLDAQIADALFGQPGMSKLDVANRLRELRGAGSPLLADAAIPTSPSPAGQGDARAKFEAWAHAQSYRGGNIITDRDADHPDVYACPNAQLTWQCWKAALAARQPVEFERAVPTRRRESAVEMLLSLGFAWNKQRWEDRREPVGAAVKDCLTTAGEPNTAPNRLTNQAQAVEMEALLGVAAEYQSWIEFHSAGNGDYDDFRRKHVLTDSQGVGNG